MPARNLPSIENTRKAVHQALRSWGSIDDLEIKLFKVLQVFRKGNATKVLGECLAELKHQNPVQFEVLQRRFVQGQPIKRVALDLHISEDHANRQQREAIDALAAMIVRREEQARREQREHLLSQLPPRTYARLFGTERTEARLGALLAKQAGPRVMAITGLGGIGKTALADAIVRATVDEFRYSRIIWIRAEPSIHLSADFQDHLLSELAVKFSLHNVPALHRVDEVKKALKTEAILIVIDNLEGQIQELDWLYLLQDFAGPSKFLLTSRVLPATLANIHVTKMRELDLKPATEFLIDHAQQIGFLNHIGELQEKAAGIYTKAGGNPLALKLIVGLLHVWPLATVLRSLEQGPGSAVEMMYRHIFEKSWQTISQPARQMLQAMPLVGEDGGSIDQLQAISSLSELETREALKELATRSLVELRQTTTNPRYGIHRLTDSFLRGQIVKTL